MSLKFPDRIVAVTSTTGTGTLNLGSSLAGYRAFSEVFSDGDITTVLIVDDPNAPSEWEVTYATYNTATPDTLTRGTLISSSTGSRIDFAAGQKQIYVQPTSDFFELLATLPNPAVASTWLRRNAANEDYEALTDQEAAAQLGAARLNRIINGDINVWQRGTSFPNANGYTADRWFTNRALGVGGMTVSRQAGDQSEYCMRLQRDSGDTSTASMAAYTALESVDSIPAKGAHLTMSFRARCGANFSAASNQITAAIMSGAHVDVRPYLVSDNKSANFNLTTDWQYFTLTTDAVIPSSHTQIGVRIYSADLVGTAGANDWIEIEQVQLEPGATDTEFVPRHKNLELWLCQAYFAKTFPQGTAPAQGAAMNGAISIGPIPASTPAGLMSINWRYPRPMRASPTVTTYAPLISSSGARDHVGDAVPVTLDFVGDSGCTAYNTNISPAGVRRMEIHLTAESEL